MDGAKDFKQGAIDPGVYNRKRFCGFLEQFFISLYASCCVPTGKKSSLISAVAGTNCPPRKPQPIFSKFEVNASTLPRFASSDTVICATRRRLSSFNNSYALLIRGLYAFFRVL